MKRRKKIQIFTLLLVPAESKHGWRRKPTAVTVSESKQAKVSKGLPEDSQEKHEADGGSHQPLFRITQSRTNRPPTLSIHTFVQYQLPKVFNTHQQEWKIKI